MKNASRKANADYTVVDREPLHLPAGTIVTPVQEDKAWEGWVWVTVPEGRGTYVPAASLERLADSQACMREAFEARDLSVRKGEAVTCLREVSGWLWCRNADGAEGWLPDYVLTDS